jgi:phosphoribosylanthranilate isomerase
MQKNSRYYILTGADMKKEKTKIKICGLSRPEDIAFVNEAHPDFCGFIINVPKSIRNTTPDQVRALRELLYPDIVPVGVFRNAPPEVVIDLLQDGTIKAAQLHGNEEEAYLGQLRTAGDWTIIQAFNEKSIARARESSADYILLDHGSGGTGQTFDWSLASGMERPWFLAGGLGADNVLQAIEALHPWAVDVSSGVETDGRKDREKILRLVELVRSAEA